MAIPDPMDSWRAQVLNGGFSGVQDVMREMLVREWPEQADRVYLRTTDRAQDFADRQQDPDYRKFSAHVLRLYESGHHSASANPDNREALRRQIDEYYDFGQTRDRAGEYLGPLPRAQGEVFADTRPAMFIYQEQGADGRWSAKSFEFPVINLNEKKCLACTAGPAAAQLSPGQQLHERLTLFSTAAHEVAHVLTVPDRGSDHVETPEEARRDEGIARVFENLMVARLFPQAGLQEMKMEASRIDYPGETLYHYEASGPLRAAMDFVTRQPDAFAQMSPRQILDLSQQLVEQHDPVNRMSGAERARYREALSNGATDGSGLDRLKDALGQLGDGPSASGARAALGNLHDQAAQGLQQRPKAMEALEQAARQRPAPP